MLRRLQHHLREAKAINACLIQHRTRAWDVTADREQGREDSRRARRQCRRAQRSLLRCWTCVSLQDEWLQDSEARHTPEELSRLTDKQLWTWMLGRRRTPEAARKASRGWQRWLKQGGSTQMGRERGRQRQQWGGSEEASTSSRWERSRTFRRWSCMSQADAGAGWSEEAGGKQAHAQAFWSAWRVHRSAFSAGGGGSSQHRASQQPEAKPAETARVRSLRVIGLSADRLTSATLREAFRRMALVWHPDRHPEVTKRAAEEKFKEVQDAYALLKSICVA